MISVGKRQRDLSYTFFFRADCLTLYLSWPSPRAQSAQVGANSGLGSLGQFEIVRMNQQECRKSSNGSNRRARCFTRSLDRSPAYPVLFGTPRSPLVLADGLPAGVPCPNLTQYDASDSYRNPPFQPSTLASRRNLRSHNTSYRPSHLLLGRMRLPKRLFA